MRAASPTRLLACLPFALALAAPSPAFAHLRTGTIAVDVAVRVTSTPAPLHAHVSLSTRAVEVSVPPGHTAVLLGYLGEPFARIGPAGVSVDATSPTAQSAGAVRGDRSLTWRDDRLQRLAPGAAPIAWRIPVVVDGRRTSIAGLVWRPPGPRWWPWLLAALAAASAAGRLRARLGLVSAACAVTAAAGITLGAYGSPGTWIAALDEAAFALAGAWLLARGPAHLRPAADALLGLLGLAVALVQVPVFLHPIVLSVLPGDVARALVAVAAGAGTAVALRGAAHYAAAARSS